MGVDTTSEAYDSQVPRWEMADNLWAGTAAMRKATATYLPQEPKETSKSYDARLGRSFLYPGFERCVQSLIGKAFASSLTIDGADDNEWTDWLDDVDLQGNKFSVFLQKALRNALKYGMTSLLADFPIVPETATLFDEREMGARPYLIERTPREIISWRGQIVGGAEQLDRVRITESVVGANPDDKWDDSFREDRVRVLYPDRFELYEPNDAGTDWLLIEEGKIAPLKHIPLTPVYLDRQGLMQSKSPLLALMELNVTHWQSYSDQRNILRFARAGIVFGKGFMKEDPIINDFVIGPNSAYFTNNVNADLKFVEHSGNAINAGRQDCLDLEDRMAMYGAEMLASRPGNPTATGKAIDSRDATSPLAQWVATLEDAANSALEDMAEFAQVDNVPTVKMSRDFGIIGRLEDLDHLWKLRQGKEISREEFFIECKRRGFIRDDYDAEADQEIIDAEGPSADMLASQAILAQNRPADGKPPPPNEPPIKEPPAA